MGRGAYTSEESERLSEITNRTPVESKLAVNKDEVVMSWKDIKEGNNEFIVIKGKVYDVSKFMKRHPGGRRILVESINQDATDSFHAFHSDLNKVSKYMKPLQVGRVEEKHHNEYEPNKDAVMEDFRDLRALAEKMGLFKSSSFFFAAHFLQIIALEVAATAIIAHSGATSWVSWLIALALMVTAQAQAGWTQHDYGHLSVFQTSAQNHFMHHIVIGFIKGVSADWWNYRHFRHHAKPNAHHVDPDIGFGKVLIVGKTIPKELGLKKKGAYDYRIQGKVFMMLLPPLLLPVAFVFENVIYCWKRNKIMEVTWVGLFFVRFFFQYGPSLGAAGAIGLYFAMRFFESFWFVFVTQMNHIPMESDRDHDLSWFRQQLLTTCNVEKGTFNDWFTGHLNFQIEHHLFPTMPRHNYHKIQPFVQSMAKKHEIPYVEKGLVEAMADIYHSLNESGEVWYEAYQM